MRKLSLLVPLLVASVIFTIGAIPASAAVNCSASGDQPSGMYHTNSKRVQLDCTGAVDQVQFGNTSQWYMPDLPPAGGNKYLTVAYNPNGGYAATTTVPGTQGQITWAQSWMYYKPDAPVYGYVGPGITICADKHMSSPGWVGFRLLFRVHNPNNGGSWGGWRAFDDSTWYTNC